MEGLGKKLQEARVARYLSLDEAARLTKIRSARLKEIENEDFSQFASLAYAKGFLQIYGKFLDVDVTPYMEAFETSEHMTVDGYSYLQDNPAPKPTRPAVARIERSGRGSFIPFVIGVIILVLGFFALRLLLDLQRIKPRAPDRGAVGQTTPASPSPAPEKIAAPHALPAESSTAPLSQVEIVASTPAIQPRVAPPQPTASEPEVRRAEPVRAEDLVDAPANVAATASAARTTNRLEVRALKKTYLKVVVDNGETPALERWITPSEGPVQFHGKHIAIRVLDPNAVELRKNGKRISNSDPDITIE